MLRTTSVALLIAMVIAALGCGGGSGSGSQSNPGSQSNATSVVVTPGAVGQVWQGTTVQFTAQVTGQSNKTVVWNVREGSAGGTIDSTGLYTAPSAAGTFHVGATSQADPKASGTASVEVAPLTVLISPAADTLRIGGQRQFGAFAVAANQNVTWKLQEGAAGGNITAYGFYTAPTTTGTFHVIATSVFNTSVSSTAPVTIVTIGFAPISDMEIARSGHTATLLLNGRVLVAGGENEGMGALEKAELFDHATITFTSTGSMVHPRWSHSAVLLSSGKVLVAGGSDSSGALISAELFDPATGSFEATGDLLEPRSGATGTLLVSGKVLIAGGTGGSGQVLATAELYDPITGTFSETGRMTSARSRHTATFLASGKVLLVGGRKDITPASAVSTAELFDPSRNAFVATGPMATARANHTATLLPDGKVLVLGGAPSDRVSLSSGESYDPGTGTFNAASHLEEQRDSHTATLLPSGKVLVAGGGMQLYDTEAPHGPHFFITSFTAELSEANSGGFIFTGSLETGRSGHSATLLGNGAVLVTGGTGYGGNALATAEMYQ